MNSPSQTRKVKAEKHFTSSIQLWMRNDQPRQIGMDYWQGPHSGIIANTPGLHEYRQIHLAADNPGMWPAVDGVETAIRLDRKIDGIAEVTFESALSPLAGRTQTALAFQDEVNVFRRTLLYAGPPKSSRWYHVGQPGAQVGSRVLINLRRAAATNPIAFHRVVRKELTPALAATGVLSELRTQTFLPWSEKLWNTPNVAHDNPSDQHLHASIVLGFDTTASKRDFFTGTAVDAITAILHPVVCAIHAYEVEKTLIFVKDGQVLPHYEN